MNVYFGNLTVEQLEARLETKLTKTDRVFLEKHRTDNASFSENDKFHIFDMPLCIHSGADVVTKVEDILRKYNKRKLFKANIAIYV